MKQASPLKGEPIPCPRGLQTLFSSVKSFKTLLSAPKYFENMLNNIFDQEQWFSSTFKSFCSAKSLILNWYFGKF